MTPRVMSRRELARLRVRVRVCIRVRVRGLVADGGCGGLGGLAPGESSVATSVLFRRRRRLDVLRVSPECLRIAPGGRVLGEPRVVFLRGVLLQTLAEQLVARDRVSPLVPAGRLRVSLGSNRE